MIVPNKIEPLAAESWYCLENLPEISDFPELKYFSSLARESKEIPFGLGRAVAIKHHLLAYAWARASLLAPDRYPDHLNQFLGFLWVILEAKPIGLKGRTDQQKTEILIIHQDVLSLAGRITKTLKQDSRCAMCLRKLIDISLCLQFGLYCKHQGVMASEITYHPSEAEIWTALQELKLKETATSSQQGQFELKLEDFCEHIRTLLPRSLWRLNAWCFLLEMEMYLRG